MSAERRGRASGPGPEIPFNRPFLAGTETRHIEDAVRSGWLASGGEYTERCEAWLEERTGAGAAYLTHTGTAALEAAALIAGFGPDDEVIMPSFTFPTTASAVALRGATPVFVDVEPDALTIDPECAAAAIGPRTKAIVAVHYAGVAAEMDALRGLADEHGLLLIEDAAQGLLSSVRGRPLGGLGDLGAISFHETKNVTCGEGGALLVNDPGLRERAEIVCEKGTDRRKFERGEVERYTWVDLGSSFRAGEVAAAFLWAQLEEADAITARRRRIWDRYHDAFAGLEAEGRLRRPIVPDGRVHNAHMYHLLLPGPAVRGELIEALGARGILAVFHYVPLHSSPAGRRYGRADGELTRTDDLSARLVRLPLWTAMSDDEVDRVIAAVGEALSVAR